MKFIIGLGNPGKKYSSTRHNVGFAVLDNFAEDKSLKWREYKDRALVSVCDDFILVKPMLFMNRSGSAVESLVKKYLPRRQAGGTDFEDIIVVSDDMDISFGNIRIKKGGSSGGHNGVESIIETLGTNEFIRMRIGIGRPPLASLTTRRSGSDTVDAVDFVLSNFSQEEARKMKSVIPRASDAVSVFIDSGLQKTMNLFNKRR